MNLLIAATLAATLPYSYYQPQFQIFGIPVSTPYYYSVNEVGKADRIAAQVVEILEAKFADDVEVEPKLDRDGFGLVGPAGDDAVVLGIFKVSCVRCHKAGSTKPGVILLAADGSLFSDPDAAREGIRRLRISESVAEDRMPKNGHPLSAAEKAAVEAWSQALQGE